MRIYTKMYTLNEKRSLFMDALKLEVLCFGSVKINKLFLAPVNSRLYV